MNIILKQSGNKIGLYIDKTLSTVFEDKTMDDVVNWIKKNLLNPKIHIIGN